MDQCQITANRPSALDVRPLRAGTGVRLRCGMSNLAKGTGSGNWGGSNVGMKWIKGRKGASKEIWRLIPQTFYPYQIPLPKPSKLPILKSNPSGMWTLLNWPKWRELCRKEDDSKIPLLLLFHVNHFFLALLSLPDGFYYERNHLGVARTPNQNQACASF